MIEGKKDVQSVDRFWEPVGQPLIEGVVVRDVRHVVKDSGHLTELYRRDWGVGPGVIEQVFQVVLLPGAVSAWHAHRTTTDHLFVVSGTQKLALFDGRETSSTTGRLNTFRIGSLRPSLVLVPPGVWHGMKNIGDSASAVINLVDAAYDYEDPDHWRVPADAPEIPFSWD